MTDPSAPTTEDSSQARETCGGHPSLEALVAKLVPVTLEGKVRGFQERLQAELGVASCRQCNGRVDEGSAASVGDRSTPPTLTESGPVTPAPGGQAPLCRPASTPTRTASSAMPPSSSLRTCKCWATSREVFTFDVRAREPYFH
jgi:hypothetical protein